MTNHTTGLLALAGLASLAACGPAHAQQAVPTALPATAAPAVPEAASVAPPKLAQPLQPGLDDLMTMLVAPRHLKLHLAGTHRNWELAAFELRELRAAMRRVARVVPRYQDRDMEETLAALIEPQFDSTNAAILAGDTVRFAQAFARMTAACNACHTYLEHPFIVVKVPAPGQESAYPAQEFRAPR